MEHSEMTCLETSKGPDTCLVQLSGGRASLLDMLTSPMTSLLSGGETGWRYSDQRLVLTHSSLMLENITGFPHPSLSTPSTQCPPGMESSPLTMSTQVVSTNHSSVLLTLTNHSGSVRRHGGGE